MNGRTTIRLIAEREVRVKLASKSFLIATGALVAVMLLGGLLFKVVGSSDPLKVGLTPDTSALASSVTALGGSSEVETEDVTDVEAGKKQVRDGDLDALLVETPTGFEVFVDSDLDTTLESVFAAISQQQALSSEIKELGGDPDKVAQALVSATPTVTELDPNDTDGAQVVAGYVVGILIFLGLIMTGQLVAQGVVEEKTSRVVEILLATVRPWQLMVGKVLGIGLVGLLQIAAVVLSGTVSALAFGLLDTSSLNLGVAAVGALGWFVIGYTTFALLLAGLAALVSRQEEVASVTSPVTMLMTVPYIVGVSVAIWDPDAPIVVWMSQIPFCAPMVMPIRMAAGEVPGWQLAVSIGLSLAVVPVLVWLAGRMYSNAVLQTGDRMKLLQALKTRN